MSAVSAFAPDWVQRDPVPIPAHVVVIAEVGINHNGDIDLAKNLIREARLAGCDAVKFQKRTIDVVYSAEMLAEPRESPWGSTQREQKEGLEFGRAEYDVIDALCRDLGIAWSASAWDIDSQRFLAKYNLKFNKVASAMITNVSFLEVVAKEQRPTYISTGMSTLEEIDLAVNVFRTAECPFVLMHSVSTYPADESTLNLAAMATLRQRYGVPVGYSGHEPSVSPSVVAAALGAVVIERHLTLDRAMYGSDQSASLEPIGLRNMVEMVRKVPRLLGDGEKRLIEAERPIARKLRYWEI